LNDEGNACQLRAHKYSVRNKGGAKGWATAHPEFAGKCHL
jgi:hypothetical protein